jgi:hypothetical protein
MLHATDILYWDDYILRKELNEEVFIDAIL